MYLWLEISSLNQLKVSGSKEFWKIMQWYTITYLQKSFPYFINVMDDFLTMPGEK